jgi:hypothetical protein
MFQRAATSTEEDLDNERIPLLKIPTSFGEMEVAANGEERVYTEEEE